MNDKNISVLGIGRLGLCFALTLEKGGYNVLGLDIRKDYVFNINHKIFNSYEPYVNNYLDSAINFRATTSLIEALNYSDIIFITVRTTSLENGEYDCSQADVLFDDILKIGDLGCTKCLIICCNVNPGYSNSISDKLKDIGYVVNFNPEWVAQGSILYNQSNPDLVVIGEDNPTAGYIIEKVYKKVCANNPPIYRMDRLSAEITKIGLNCYLTTKISYANALGQIAIKSGVDPTIILNAIGADSRINPKYFQYGFGYGGPCFHRDTRAMEYYCRRIDIDPLIISAVRGTNNNHLQFQLNEFFDNNKKNDPVVFDSVTYKKGTIIIEESQQLLFAVGIAKEGYSVTIRERPEVIEQVKNIYGNLFIYEERK